MKKNIREIILFSTGALIICIGLFVFAINKHKESTKYLDQLQTESEKDNQEWQQQKEQEDSTLLNSTPHTEINFK